MYRRAHTRSTLSQCAAHLDDCERAWLVIPRSVLGNVHFALRAAENGSWLAGEWIRWGDHFPSLPFPSFVFLHEHLSLWEPLAYILWPTCIFIVIIYFLSVSSAGMCAPWVQGLCFIHVALPALGLILGTESWLSRYYRMGESICVLDLATITFSFKIKVNICRSSVI